MGQLKPGVSYIYEKADGITYAREPGQDIRDRVEIGRDYNRTRLDHDIECRRLLGEILTAAETNPALQKAIDRVIILYKLSNNPT